MGIVPMPDIYVCLPSPPSLKSKPPGMFIQGIQVMELVQEGVAGCWSGAGQKSQNCREDLAGVLHRYRHVSGSNYAKLAFAAQFKDQHRFFKTSNPNAAIHIMLVTMRNEPDSEFVHGELIPPLGSLLKLVNPVHERNPRTESEAVVTACVADRSSAFAMASGTYLGAFHEVHEFELNADHAYDDPSRKFFKLDK